MHELGERGERVIGRVELARSGAADAGRERAQRLDLAPELLEPQAELLPCVRDGEDHVARALEVAHHPGEQRLGLEQQIVLVLVEQAPLGERHGPHAELDRRRAEQAHHEGELLFAIPERQRRDRGARRAGAIDDVGEQLALLEELGHRVQRREDALPRHAEQRRAPARLARQDLVGVVALQRDQVLVHAPQPRFPGREQRIDDLDRGRGSAQRRARKMICVHLPIVTASPAARRHRVPGGTSRPLICEPLVDARSWSETPPSTSRTSLACRREAPGSKSGISGWMSRVASSRPISISARSTARTRGATPTGQGVVGIGIGVERRVERDHQLPAARGRGTGAARRAGATGGGPGRCSWKSKRQTSQ